MQRVCRCRTEPTSLALALCCAGRLLLHYRIGQGRVLCHSRCALPTSHTTCAAQPSHDCRRQQYVALSAPALLCFAAPPRCCLPTTYPGPPIPERTLSEVLRGPIYCALTSAVLWSAMFRTGSAAPKLVKEYAAGDSFGELALLHGDPRAASGTPRSVHAADGADECCAVQCCAVLCCALQCSAVLFDLQLKRQSRCACGKWTARRSGTPSASRVCGTRRPRAMVSADNADGIMRAVCVSGCQRIT